LISNQINNGKNQDMGQNNNNLNALTNIVNSTIKEVNQPSNLFTSNLKNMNFKKGRNSLAEEEIKNKNKTSHKEDSICDSSDDEKPQASTPPQNLNLFISVKLSHGEEFIQVNKNDDTLKITHDFIFKHQMNEKLIKPLHLKIVQALSSIEMLPFCDLTEKQFNQLSEIRDYFFDGRQRNNEYVMYD